MSENIDDVAAILAELDGKQQEAATADRNVVVAAGAGSGKTKTLAARYVWLVMERGLAPDNILTLTFTKKAAAEMHSRIYQLLASRRDNERAAAALREFESARIGTIDSFCAAVARASSRRWGIKPEFTTDDAALREMAGSAALSFVLEYRSDPALAAFLAAHNLRDVAENLFADLVVSHSPLSRPVDFDAALARQKEAATAEMSNVVREIENALCTIKGILIDLESKKSGGTTYEKWKTVWRDECAAPDVSCLDDTAQSEVLKTYLAWLTRITDIPNSIKHDYLKDLKNRICIKKSGKRADGLYVTLASLANTALQWDTVAGIFALLKKFQDEFNQQKRAAGVLSFTDIAHIAHDTLQEDTALRAYYKRRIRAIMIDEFQDNNSLQRDLVFLLAEKDDRCVPGIPQAADLDAGKLFFVGDEKQSIYRFRGADVSVFRALSRDLAQSTTETVELSLPYNYRSHPALIDAFNQIFARVFASKSGGETADFEARHSDIAIPETRQGEERQARVHFALLDKALVEKDAGLSASDIEAAYIAGKIREMLDSGFEIDDKTAPGGKRKCRAQDFAVLQRTYSNQASLEREFKRAGLQFTSSSPKGLFYDAPLNDLCAFPRLAVYPNDRVAYAAALRSPFVRLSADGLAQCLLSGGEPFNAETEKLLSANDRERFARGRALYEKTRDTTVPVTETLSDMWYSDGYRYETLWSAESEIYAGLFDTLFDIARSCDERGLGLAGFVDHIETLIAEKEKLDLNDTADDDAADGDAASGVKLLSVHASKGMEFPVVFIYKGDAKGKGERDDKIVYFNRDFGPTLKLPQSDALPEKCGNYFFKLEQEKAKAEAEAELRRLLYVAMTRAESALFFTATMKGQTKDEKEIQDMDGDEYDDTYIQTRVNILYQCRTEKENTTFLDLLLPVLAKTAELYAAKSPPRLFTVEKIPVYTYAELTSLAGSMKECGVTVADPFTAAQAAKACYETAALRDAGPLVPEALNASALGEATEILCETAADGAESDPVYKILREANLAPADFGTITHAYIEARFSNKPPRFPICVAARQDETAQAVLASAEKLAAQFFVSKLGQEALASGRRESEFDIVTLWEHDGTTTLVDGRIDLVFEKDGEVVVVDFKTDRIENPAEHTEQLAVYKQAAADIFGKPARAYLYYLRSGREVELGA